MLVFLVEAVQPSRDNHFRLVLWATEILPQVRTDWLVHLRHQVKNIQHVGVQVLVLMVRFQLTSIKGDIIIDRNQLGWNEPFFIIVEMHDEVVWLAITRADKQRRQEHTWEIFHVDQVDKLSLAYSLCKISPHYGLWREVKFWFLTICELDEHCFWSRVGKDKFVQTSDCVLDSWSIWLVLIENLIGSVTRQNYHFMSSINLVTRRRSNS